MEEKTEVHCRVELTFVKGDVSKTYNTLFRTDFLDERPLGMAFLVCNEELEGLFDFITGKLKGTFPDKEKYVVKDALGIVESDVSQETKENDD